MGEYDSDESLSDAEFSSNADYIQTNVLLGYASQKARKPKDDQFSQLGGHPTWLDDKTAPSGALAKCKSCNEYMSLYLQIYSNIPEKFPGHERALYVFGCRRKPCRRKEGSIRGIRAVRAEKVQVSQSGKDITKATATVSTDEKSAPPQPRNLGSSLFGVAAPGNGGLANLNPFPTGPAAGGNPFSKGSSTSTVSNPFASASNTQPRSEIPTPTIKEPPTTDLAQSFADKVKINADVGNTPAAVPRPHEPWPEQSKFPSPYPKHFIDVQWEELDNPKQQEALPAGVRLDTEMMDEDAGSGGAMSGDTKTLFESSMDKAFQKYADRVAQNYEQVLRYEHAGQPLLYSTDDAVGKLLSPHPHPSSSSSSKVTTSGGSGKGMPRCGNCGAKRVFEMQMTSNAIVELEAEEDALEGMDWGTVLVGVCERDCLPKGIGEREVGYVEEWVGVQWEELNDGKRR